jgi:uncharacterized membrane protein HdeD (DUF308 family)
VTINGLIGKDNAAGVTRVSVARTMQPWWTPFVIGALSIAAGCAVLTESWTIQRLAYFAGIFFVVRGLTIAFNPIYRGTSVLVSVLAAVFGTLAGILLVVWPGPSLLVLAVFIGAWLTVSGAFNILTAVSLRRALPYWVLLLVFGASELLLGMWAMRRPAFSLALTITVVGFWAIITGVALCLLALELHYLATAAVVVLDGSPASGATPTVFEGIELITRLHQAGVLSETESATLMARVADRAGTHGRRGA